MTLRTEEYLAYIAAPIRRRPALPATILTYRNALSLFERWLGEREARQETAQAWLEALTERGLKASYVSKVAVCVQSYLQWATGDRDVLLEYRRGFDPHPPNFYYSAEEVQRFMAKLTGAPRCALILQFDCGARIGGLLSVRLAYKDAQSRPATDVHLDPREDPEAPYLNLYLKGGKQGRSSLSERGVEAIQRWLKESERDRRSLPRPERDLLFVDWDYASIYDAYKEAAAEAGLAFRGTHALRHSFAAFQVSQGTDMPAISQQLHHSNLNTTAKIYAPLGTKDLRKRLKGW